MTTTDSLNTHGTTSSVTLAVDEDLTALFSDIVASHSRPDVQPDPEALWSTLREVGLARLTAPEQSGGSGAGWAEAAALLRTTAAAGVTVPYVETDLLAGPLRRAAGINDSSDASATVALLDSTGTARGVPWAGATATVVCVRAAGDGYELADVPSGQLTITPADAVSTIPSGAVTVPDGLSWTAVDGAPVEAYVLRGALVRALQCSGSLEGMLDSAIEHTTTRQQFGRTLAKFQSVQNLVVDIAAESVLARAAVDAALVDALTHDLAGDHSQFRIAVARSVVSQALAVSVRNVHQVHGAIGTTHEHTLHRLTLPALQWRGEFGSAAFWEAFLTLTAVNAGTDGAWPLVTDGAHIDGIATAYLRNVTG